MSPLKHENKSLQSDEDPLAKVRLDKWLWAARFFKTRNLAKQAIDGGKVHIERVKAKASKEIGLGTTLSIRQGYDEREVVVTALSDQRRGAKEAALLYRETEESIKRRELAAENRRANHGSVIYTDNRPTKKERRQIHKFKADNLE